MLLLASKICQRMQTSVSCRLLICKGVRTPSTGNMSKFSQLTESQQYRGGDKNYRPKDRFLSMNFVIVAIVAGVDSILYFHNLYSKAKKEEKLTELKFVNDQIQTLYGPLYSNRIVAQTTFRGAVGDHKSLGDLLETAKEKKDVKAVDDWRQFIWKILFPLDKEACDLINENPHLIEGDFPKEFEKFLRHYGKICYVTEKWNKEDGEIKKANGDFLEEDYLERTNASGERGLNEVLEHAKHQFKELKRKQKQLVRELNQKQEIE